MNAPDRSNPIEYAHPPRRLPQGEIGGVSAVVGGVMVFLTLCAMALNLAFTGDTTARRLMRFEAGIIGGMALIGVLLAVVGLFQRGRRVSAAIFGLVLNLAMLLAALAGLKWL